MPTPIGSVFEVCFKYTVNGQVCRNYLHYSNLYGEFADNPIVVQDAILDEIVDADAGSARSALIEVLAANVTLNEVTCQMIWENRWRKSVYDVPATGADVSSMCDAQNLQVSIMTHGDEANRHNIGGWRIGGLPTGRADNGFLAAAAIANFEALETAWTTFFNITLSASNPPVYPVILKRKKVIVEGKDKYILDGYTVMTGSVLKQDLRTQRSRNVGRGE